jgi:uncharacterized protein YlxW (UPF0749 family)
MATPEGERIARVEEQIRDMRQDLRDHAQEQQRTRNRIHDLEGAVGMLVDNLKVTRRSEETRYKGLNLRIQVLTLVIGSAGIVTPIFVVYVGRH